MAVPLLKVRDVVQEYRNTGQQGASTRGLLNVSFDIERGEILGLVGESGAGKTTLLRSLLQIVRPTSGMVQFEGHDLTRLGGRALVENRKGMQLIFQDPVGSLDPRWCVAQIVEEPLVGFRYGGHKSRKERVQEVMEVVGLPVAQYGHRYPGELSGGQCQRVAIARALAPKPTLLLCDEAVSALDVLIQAQLIDLFEQLRDSQGLSYIFVSHDLQLVQRISDRVAVMYAGQICESGSTVEVFNRPVHPYTAALLRSSAIK